jgi:hypothetical protein
MISVIQPSFYPPSTLRLPPLRLPQLPKDPQEFSQDCLWLNSTPSAFGYFDLATETYSNQRGENEWFDSENTWEMTKYTRVGLRYSDLGCEREKSVFKFGLFNRHSFRFLTLRCEEVKSKIENKIMKRALPHLNHSVGKKSKFTLTDVPDEVSPFQIEKIHSPGLG